MAPKKKQQQQKQKQNRHKSQQSSSSTVTGGGAKLQLSAENEQRIRRLLLNNNYSDTIRPTATVTAAEETRSLSRAQKAKRLKAVFEKLSCECFSDDQIESALGALQDTATFETALEWLCLNLPPDDLPLKFANASSLHAYKGSISVVSTSREDWTPLEETSEVTEEKKPMISVRIKGQRDDDSLDSLKPSQADWIRQYMEKEEEIESATWEGDLSDDWSIEKDSIVMEYQAARAEAVSAKEKGDKKGQEKASYMIRKLKQELSSLGSSLAVLCAGLYPNVAAKAEGIYAPALGNFKQLLQSATRSYPAWYDGRREVHMHPSSVNSGTKAFQYPFVVFLEKVETHKVFLRDTSVISPYSLLLFGGSISIQHQMGVITIDGWLNLTASAQTAVLFKELRLTLDKVLKDLISHPERGAVDNEVVQSIIQLLQEENRASR